MDENQKKSYTFWILIAIALVLTLPVFYLVFVHVLLPLGWDE